MARLTVRKITSTCLPPSVVVVKSPSWPTALPRWEGSGIPTALLAWSALSSYTLCYSLFHLLNALVSLPFVEQECKQSFGGGSFYDYEGKPYCEKHYHSQRGSLCASCLKPVLGRCITAIGKRFHPEHFVCAFCMKQLAQGTFKDNGGKPYCLGCHVKLFG